jgi:hypothetical protein
VLHFKAAAAEAKAAAKNAPVQLKMTLGLDFSMTGSEGSDKREKFKRDVAQDLASASGLPPANFRIRDVSPGSIVLDIEVMPDPLAPGMHLWAAKYLGEQVSVPLQAADPSSTLRSVKITSHTTGVDVIPPKSGEVSAAKAEEALNGGSSDTFLQKGEIKRATRSAPVATVSRGAEVLEDDFCSVPIHKDTAEFLEGKDVLVESALEKLLVLHRHVQAQLQDAHARACDAKDVLEAEKAQLLSQIEEPGGSSNEHQHSLERIQQQHAQVQAALQSLDIVLQEENLPPQREAGIARQGALEASTAELRDMRRSGMQQTRLQNQKAGDLSLISSAPLRPFIQAHENSDPVQHLPAGKPDSLCETKQELVESHAESMETPKRSFQASLESQPTPTPQKCATPRLWGDDQFLVSAKNRLWGSSVALDAEQTLSQAMSRMGLEEEKVTVSSRDSGIERQSRARLRVKASNRRTVI